jgi:hypothetical protein
MARVPSQAQPGAGMKWDAYPPPAASSAALPSPLIMVALLAHALVPSVAPALLASAPAHQAPGSSATGTHTPPSATPTTAPRGRLTGVPQQAAVQP